MSRDPNGAGAVNGERGGSRRWLSRVVKEDPSEEVVFELRSERNRNWQWEDVEEDGTQRWFSGVAKEGPL